MTETELDKLGAMDKLNALIEDAQRYRIVRQMKPKEFDAAWWLNIRTGKPFDQIIDEMRPFYESGPND
jgi:hypothetical protein